jgi:hypothetical protein
MTATERLRTAAVTTAVREGKDTTALGEFGCFVAGQWIETNDAIEVRSPYDASLVAVVHRAGSQIEAAIAAAVKAFEITRKLPSWNGRYAGEDQHWPRSTPRGIRLNDCARSGQTDSHSARRSRSRDHHHQSCG